MTLIPFLALLIAAEPAGPVPEASAARTGPSAPLPAQENLKLRSEVGGRTGAFFQSSGDMFLTPGAFGRFRAVPAGTFADHLYVEGDATVSVTLTSRALSSVVTQLRLGLAFPTWTVSLGAWANICPRCFQNPRYPGGPYPIHVLPSLTAAWRPSTWGLSLGILDQPTGSVGHLDFDWKDLSVGYNFPIGGHVRWRIPLGPVMAVQLEAMGFVWAGAYQVGGSIGLLYVQGS